MSLKAHKPDLKEKQSQSNKKKNDLDMGLHKFDPGELSVLFQL